VFFSGTKSQLDIVLILFFFGLMQVQTIEALRAFLAKPELGETGPPRVPLGHAVVDACLKGGLERAVLHEVFSAIGHETAATGFAAGLAARVAGSKHMLWIAQDFSATEFGALSATGFLELGLDPSRLLMLCVANADDGLRAAGDALTCAALGAVVIEIPGHPKILDMTTSRRLTLACAQNNVTAILLRFAARPSFSTAETRWLVSGAASIAQENWGQPIFQATLLRNRHGQTGEWMMEWCGDERIFKAPHETKADHRPLVSAPVD
jgi:protein ImuA